MGLTHIWEGLSVVHVNQFRQARWGLALAMAATLLVSACAPRASAPAASSPAPAPAAVPASGPSAAAPDARPAEQPVPRDFPGGPVEWVIASNPGGSFDVFALAIIKALKDEGLSAVNHNPSYKPGGGSVVGWTYVEGKKGAAQVVTPVAPQFLTNRILGLTKLSYTQFTPIAQLVDEYIALAIRADLPVKTGAEFLAELKKDPKKYSIGIATAAGNQNHQAFAKAARSAGVNVRELRTVIFASGGEAKTALLGGKIDAWTTTSGPLEELLASDKVRVVAVSSEQRLKAPFDKVPTWKEQGINGTFSSWRGVVGPPDLKPEDAANWQRLLSAVVKTKAWQEMASKYQWSPQLRTGEEFHKFLDQENAELTDLLKELGMVK